MDSKAEITTKILSLLNYSPLKILRSPDDPFFDEGNQIFSERKLAVFHYDDEELLHKSFPEFECHVESCHKSFTSIQAYERHYNSIHKYVCSDCHRLFPSSHLLDIHVLEKHDTLFQIMSEKEKMYSCLVESCMEKFWSPEERKKHLIKIHKYPSDFRFDRSEKMKMKDNPSGNSMEVETSDPSRSEETVNLGAVRKFQYRVPKTISFGRGAVRGFPSGRKNSGRKKQSKEWHHQHKDESKNTLTDIEKMDFSDLQATLEGEQSVQT